MLLWFIGVVLGQSGLKVEAFDLMRLLSVAFQNISAEIAPGPLGACLLSSPSRSMRLWDKVPKLVNKVSVKNVFHDQKDYIPSY